MTEDTIIIATRGSALALAQANMVLGECSRKFPKIAFALKIIKSTGDRLQAIPMSRIDATLPRGLFTKELEVALLNGRADMAVHSLKDLPTQLPDGLTLGAVAGKRADVRDVLIYRDVFKPKTKLADFPPGLVLATSSTRRKAQILARRPDFKVVEIRGNVHTRLQKLAGQAGLDATLLAAAGLGRLQLQITAGGRLKGEGAPPGLAVTILDTDEMLPCVGQGALGLEIREKDERMADICRRLNHHQTFQCVTAERALLSALGGGCQTPIGACASVEGGKLCLRAVSFLTDKPRRATARAPLGKAAALGERVAARLI
ncbi:MAG: hydroxymethylbilane synthase [Verrucomicrobiota bacterium]|jgi:hydroxymethylbilane synthase